MRDLDERLTSFLSDTWEGNGQPMICQVLVAASFLDGDGDHCWAYFPMGEGGPTGLIGLLDLVKSSIVDQVLYDEDEEDE